MVDLDAIYLSLITSKAPFGLVPVPARVSKHI